MLVTTLRRKKTLGSMPSPAFARQALEPVNRVAVALAVGVVHSGKQVGRTGQIELDARRAEVDAFNSPRRTSMTNSRFSTALCLLSIFGVPILAAASSAQQRPPILEKLAKTYGL